jgi:hypothetical protein
VDPAELDVARFTAGLGLETGFFTAGLGLETGFFTAALGLETGSETGFFRVSFGFSANFVAATGLSRAVGDFLPKLLAFWLLELSLGFALGFFFEAKFKNICGPTARCIPDAERADAEVYSAGANAALTCEAEKVLPKRFFVL